MRIHSRPTSTKPHTSENDGLVYPNPRPVAVDLFSGVGGMSLGFEQSGFDIAFSVDRDPYHTAAHSRNFPYGISVCAPIAQLNAETIRLAANIRGEVDLVFGGPPCQGFSYMGLRDHADPRNNLVAEFARIVKELQPKAFVMENVPGMQLGPTKEIFERAIELFESYGYVITFPVQTLNAMSFGVPQNRSRLFILGLRKDIRGPLAYPKGLCKGQAPRPTVLEALEGLPDLQNIDSSTKSTTFPYDDSEAKSRYSVVARGIGVDPSDASRPRIWNKLLCSGCFIVKHSEEVRALYAATAPGQMVPGHKLPRLDPNGVAPTLRAGSESERGSHTAPRPIHPVYPRCITVREAARLHGFPDWFSFYPAKWHAYRQIGNAVCPQVARAIGWEIIKVLGCELTSASPREVELRDEYILPENRPKLHKRISQIDEFPKVINFLFSRAFDDKRRVLREFKFTHDDIRKAISATSANMPRTRPERFLEEVSRSRNVRKILALPLKYGLSIVANSVGGEFVPCGEAGTLESTDSITVKSRDLISAIPLRGKAVLGIKSVNDFLPLLEHKRLVQELWHENSGTLRFERDLYGISSGQIVDFVFTSKKRKTMGSAIVSENGRLPNLSKIEQILLDRGKKIGMLLARPTQAHFLIVKFGFRKGGMAELERRAYQLRGGRSGD